MNKLLLTHLINLSVCTTIGIMDTIIRASILPLFSWLFIAGWISGTIYYFERINKHKRFHVRYNHWFFLFWPNFLAAATLAFGAFCVVFNYSFLGPFHFSIFTILFALPYLIVGTVFFSKVLKRYQVIHVRGKEVNSRVIGFMFLPIFIIVLFLIAIIVHMIDVIALSFGVINLILLIQRIIYNVTHKSLTIPTGTTRRPPAPTRRRTPTPSRTPAQPPPSTPDDLPLLSAAAANASPVMPSARQRNRTGNRPYRPSQNSDSRRRSRNRSRGRTPERSASSGRTKRKSNRSFLDKIDTKIRELLPTGANIDLNDFKCLFCFDLLNRQERNRKIIICERCKRPAHLDEWNAWKSTSSHCPRCNAPVNRASKIVTISVYKKAIAFFTKNKDKFRNLVIISPSS